MIKSNTFKHSQSNNYLLIWKLILFLYCSGNKLEIFWKYFANIKGRNKMQKKRMQNKRIQIKATLNVKLLVLQILNVSTLHANCWCQYMFKVSNRNTRARCEICSKLTMKTPERHHWRRSGVFIVNFEHILHLVLVFLLLTLSR